MKIKILIEFFVCVLLTFCWTASGGLPVNENVTNFPINGITTTDDFKWNNSTTQFINSLTITDVRNILEILLVTLKKQPDIPTLKILGRLINTLIKQNNATKELHQKLVHELQLDEELRTLLDGLDVDVITKTPFKIFSEHQQAVSTDEAIQPMNSYLPKFTTDSILPITHPFKNDEPKTETAVDEPQQRIENENNDSTKPAFLKYAMVGLSVNVTPNLNSSYQMKVINTSTASVKSPVSASEIELIQNPSSDFIFTDSSEAGDETSKNPKLGFKLRGRIDNKIFPILSERMLHILSKFHIKFVRTYSEILEPQTNEENEETLSTSQKEPTRKTRSIQDLAKELKFRSFSTKKLETSKILSDHLKMKIEKFLKEFQESDDKKQLTKNKSHDDKSPLLINLLNRRGNENIARKNSSVVTFQFKTSTPDILTSSLAYKSFNPNIKSACPTPNLETINKSWAPEKRQLKPVLSGKTSNEGTHLSTIMPPNQADEATRSATTRKPNRPPGKFSSQTRQF